MIEQLLKGIQARFHIGPLSEEAAGDSTFARITHGQIRKGDTLIFPSEGVVRKVALEFYRKEERVHAHIELTKGRRGLSSDFYASMVDSVEVVYPRVGLRRIATWLRKR